MRVAAIGRTAWLYESVRRLHERGHEIVLIVTAAAAPEYTVTERDFERLADELGCPFAFAAADALRGVEADVGVSVNWLTLIPPEILDRFPHGILNGHPGDLPRFRGNAAPNWAILAGEPRVVATVHRMTPGLDDGPILAQRSLELDERTYIADVYAFLERAFPELFTEAVDALAAGTANERPQPDDPRLALRCYPRLPRDSEIDWRLPAADIARLVRASAEPFAGAYSWLEGEKLTVWRARAESDPSPRLGVPGQVAHRRLDDGTVAVLAGYGLLIVEEAERAGRRGPATDILGSARLRLGVDMQALLDRVVRLEAEVEGYARRS